MSRLSHWTRAGNLDIPPHTKSEWQTTKLTTNYAQLILNYACWPKNRPDSAKPIEVSHNGVTVYELVGAMQVAHTRRARRLNRDQAKTLRGMVKNALRGKIVCDGKLDDLYQSLNI